jgi:GH35 family endo-1,4-beta-xylanase
MPTMRELGDAVDLEIGYAVSGTLTTEAQWALTPEFSYVVVGDGSMEYLGGGTRRDEEPWPPNVFHFDGPDITVARALTYDQQMLFQHFVWGFALPTWLEQPAALAYTPAQMREILYSHVKTFMVRYAGKIRDYDVINEMLNRPSSCWTDSPGFGYADDPNPHRYAEKAFEWCRAIDPSARLVANEYQMEYAAPFAFDNYHAWLSDALPRGVPVDAVGFQAHWGDGDGQCSVATLQSRMKALADLGLDVAITEYDDYGSYNPGDFVSALLRVPNSTTFSIFGLVDDESWIRYDNPQEPEYSRTSNLVWFGNGGALGPPWTPNPKYNQVVAALQVQELRLRRCKRITPTTALLSGTRIADQAVNVTLSHGVAGNWTFPSSTRWACDVTGLTPGVTLDVTVTSGAQTATGKAVPGVLSVWEQEPLETVPAGVTRLRGSRPYGATVTVTGSGSIGSVSHPEGASGGKYWTVDITDAYGNYTVSDGTSTVQVIGLSDIHVDASPASFALTILSPTISLSLADRFRLPGPLKIWNGTTLVDGPFKVFDGSTVS